MEYCLFDKTAHSRMTRLPYFIKIIIFNKILTSANEEYY